MTTHTTTTTTPPVGLRVRDLIDLLSDLDLDAFVTFASDYGDHSHTEQVHRLRGEVDEVTIRETAYSDSGWCVADDDEDDVPAERRYMLLVIR